MIRTASMDLARHAIDAARDAICKTPPASAQKHKSYKKNVLLFSGMTLAATVVGTLAYSVLKRAIQDNKEYKDWRRSDAKLDETLESTFDASDAVAKY